MATALYISVDGRGTTIDRRREFEAEARHELFRENRLRKPREKDLRLASVFFVGKGREAAQKLATSLLPFGRQKKAGLKSSKKIFCEFAK